MADSSRRWTRRRAPPTRALHGNELHPRRNRRAAASDDRSPFKPVIVLRRSAVIPGDEEVPGAARSFEGEAGVVCPDCDGYFLEEMDAPPRQAAVSAYVPRRAPPSSPPAPGPIPSKFPSAPRVRGGGGDDAGRWTTPGHEERPKGYLLNRPPPSPGESWKWEDRELPCYVTSFLTVVILGVGLNTRPELTLETWFLVVSCSGSWSA